MTEEDMLHFEDWEKVDLRVGKILKVEDHPNADKLYILTVDLGEEEPRTIVAGLKNHCDKTDLEGKLAIFVVNLEPATLRGVKSEGMILAAIEQNEKKVCILKPDEEVEVGSKIR